MIDMKYREENYWTNNVLQFIFSLVSTYKYKINTDRYIEAVRIMITK